MNTTDLKLWVEYQKEIQEQIYKKWFTPEPEFSWLSRPSWHPTLTYGFPILMSATQEGFMNWLAKKRKLIK